MIRRLLSVAVAITLFTVNALAQAEAEKSRPAHIGFIFPLSTNGINAGECSNDISIHAIAGLSASENAFCISGVANVVKEDAHGFIGAGVCNIIQDHADGVQMAGVINFIKNNAEGVQVAGFMNSTGNSEGAQLAGFANVASGDAYGTQAAGFINIAHSTDLQVGGFINIASNVSATQVAGFMNTATNDGGAAQVAGFINTAGNVNTQVAGFINIAKEVKGVQLAGLINIADKSDYPIGIINLVKQGEKSLGITIDEDLTTLATFRSGGKVTYGLLGLGFNLQQYEPLYALEVGIGAHIPTGIKHFRINAEVTATSLTNFTYDVTFRSGICLMPAVTLGRNLEIFAGPTVGYTNFEYAHGNRGKGNYFWDTTYEGRYHATYIGGKAGIQFHL